MARSKPVLAEVRPSLGRSSWLDDSYRVAGVIKKDKNFLLIEELGENFVEIPFAQLERKGQFTLPRDIKFDFLGKDISRKIHMNWKGRTFGHATIERRIARALGTYDWVIKERPDAIIVWTDAYPEQRAAVMAGNDLGVPTFEVVHGGFHPVMHGHFETKRYAKYSLGSWEFRRWHEFYQLGSEMVPVGSTQMDVWARGNIDVLRQKARHKLKIPSHGTVVCYLDDAFYGRTAWSDHGRTEAQLYSFLRAYKLLETLVADPYLVFKMHPYDKQNNPREREELLLKFGIKENYAILDDNLPLSLAASDLTVGNRSTAMVEGFMIGIPALVLGFEPFFEEHWYKGFGFEVARDPNEILSKMAEILGSQDNMLSLIDETDRGARFFGSDGLASLRAVRAIGKVLRGEELGDADHGSLP